MTDLWFQIDGHCGGNNALLQLLFGCLGIRKHPKTEEEIEEKERRNKPRV